MLFSRMKPEQVFTPRLAEVNKEMYVSRPHLEKALKTGLRGHLHLIIHGESGTGKSWLYKQTFQNNSISFMVANLANASRLGSISAYQHISISAYQHISISAYQHISISAELKNLVDREEKSEKTAYSEAKSAGLNAVVAKADIAHTGQYQIGKMEPFEACLKHLHEISEEKPSVLVFDNLETAFTDLLLKELADLLILCDDERYSKYKVKILIVGVPSGVKEYFYKTPHHATVANRLVELPEVTRLEQAECNALVSRGFTEKLKYEIDDIQSLLQHVGWITDRAPQVVHEYCLELAFLCEDSHKVTSASISQADDDWLKKSQYYAYSVVESHMNERDTKAGRRNQTIFALSLCEGEQFKAAEVEDLVRQEFPLSTIGTVLNLPQMLSQLSKGERPLVRRSPKGDAFAFTDPRYRMVLRAMLKKNDERVEKRPISR